MYSVIFKEDSDKFIIMDAYYKGRWEFNRESLVGYLLAVDEFTKLRRRDFDKVKENLSARVGEYGANNLLEVLDFVKTENMPIFGDFDPTYLIHRLDRFEKGIITPPVPIIETTQRCNYHCHWCYIPTRAQNTPRYEYAELKENVVVPLLRDFGLAEWCITGGEPSMEKERAITIAALIRDASKEILGRSPTSIYMLTNGYNLSDNVERYMEAGVNCYQVALTSPHAGTDASLRRPPRTVNSYEHAVKGLKKAKSLGARTEINMIIQPHSEKYASNINDIPEMFALAREVDVNLLRIIPAVPAGKAFENRVLFSSEEYAYIKNTVSSLRQEYKNGFRIDCPLDQQIEPDRDIYCRAGTLWIYINFRGETFPCNNLQFAELQCDRESIRTKDVAKIWLESDILLKMRDFNTKTLSDECIGCAQRVECVGECRALCWARYHTIDLHVKPNPCYKEPSPSPHLFCPPPLQTNEGRRGSAIPVPHS